MTLIERASVKILEAIGTHLWGFRPNMMRHFVLEYGPIKALIWFVKHMPKYERILKTWGPIRTHLISTFLSTLQGCAYCTYGHAYAFQLHYFKQTGQLFPLDEAALIKLHGLANEDVVNCLVDALDKTGLGDEIELLHRVEVLRAEPSTKTISSTPKNKVDDYLGHLINMFAVLNFCGIKHNVVPDEAHDPINRDIQLIERYASHRKV